MNFWDNLMETDESAATYMLSYDEGPGTETRHILSNFVNIGESVLDVGAGPGWNMDHFAEYGPRLKRYKGVDYSERFVRVANERRKQKFSSSYALPFELQDCRNLKEPNKSWDVVIIQDCLEHTNGYQKPILEALRVARKRVIVAFWHLMDKEEDNPINDDGNDGWGAWYSGPKWEKYLDKLGYPWFHEQLIDKTGKPRDFYVIEKEIS